MKRKLLIVLCLAYLLTNCLVFSASAASSGECGDNATWSLSDSGVLTISGSGEIMDYIYEGANLWPLIKAPWRSKASQVKKIVINSGITKIGDNAFCCLPNVTSVSIPDTVTVIGQAAFCEDESLNNVKIPNSVTTIEKSAFKHCNKFTSITLPSNLKSLGGSAFRGCGNLKSITLPSTLSVISAWTFSYCGNLEKITLPKGITTIENFAFGYSGLTSIELPSSLLKILPNAFYDTNLTQITIPSQVTYIEQHAFGGCYKLTKVYFKGDAPSFDSHVFNQDTLKAYYPSGNATWTESVRKDYGGTVTWIAYCGNEHTWGPWQTERETSCAKQGLMVRKCTKCDATEDKSIAKTAHQYEETVMAPTCKKGGYTTHTCIACGDEYKDNKTAALPHTYQEKVIAPTCKEGGYTAHTCTVCGHEYKDNKTPAGTHVYQDEITPPNCIQKGFTTHLCTVCGDTLVDTYTEMSDHTFGDWIVVKESTCLEKGSKQRTCSVCQAQETEEMELSGHSYRDEITEATCTQQGFTTHICNLCENTVTDTYTEMKEHCFGQWEEIKAASLKEEGNRWRKCTECPAEETEAIPKLQIRWGLLLGIVGAAVILSGGIVMAVILRKKKIHQ